MLHRQSRRRQATAPRCYRSATSLAISHLAMTVDQPGRPSSKIQLQETPSCTDTVHSPPIATRQPVIWEHMHAAECPHPNIPSILIPNGTSPATIFRLCLMHHVLKSSHGWVYCMAECYVVNQLWEVFVVVLLTQQLGLSIRDTDPHLQPTKSMQHTTYTICCGSTCAVILASGALRNHMQVFQDATCPRNDTTQPEHTL